MTSTIVDEKNRFPLIPIPSSAPNVDFQKDIANAFYIEMSLIHNVFIRALNSIYYCAPRVKKSDEVSFAGYTLVFTETLHAHHHGEEEFIFPFLQTKNDMAHNLEQHDGFKKQIEVFNEYMDSVLNGKAEYSGEKVRELLESFGDVLVEHLHDEIPTIMPERMALYDQNDLAALAKKLEDHIKSFPVFRSHPFVLTHHDNNAVPNWPPVPGHVKWMAKNILYWKHRSFWKFSSFSRNGATLVYTGL